MISDACQTRRTTAGRLSTALVSMPRLPRRALLLPILEDVASGAYSVLERRYLTRVGRPHGLPTASRQRWVRPVRQSGYRDVDYLGLRTAVELDGRLGHQWTAEKWARTGLGRPAARVPARGARSATSEDFWRLAREILHCPGQQNAPPPLGDGAPMEAAADQPLRWLICSVAAGRTWCRSPTTPKSTSSKIGASSSLLTATMVFEVCIPARCWIAPEMPLAT